MTSDAAPLLPRSAPAGEGWSAASAWVRAADGTTRCEEVRASSRRFDLASLTKAFVAVTALTVVDEGLLDLDAPVREHLDVAAVRGDVTARHLLTHTAGLRAVSDAWRTATTPSSVLDDVLGTAPVEAPGTVHRYSCLGFVVAGLLLEEVTGTPLDRLVAGRVAGPLGTAVRWAPLPSDDAVPTEPGTPTGRVHDELAAALARPVGNAGLFGTVDDVARLALLVAREGAVEGRQVLSRDRWRELVEPDPVARAAGAGYGQAVGLRRGDPRSCVHDDQVGHTGFTGTSFVVDLRSGGCGVLLTDRVHGGRDGTDVDDRRRRVAALAAGPAGDGSDATRRVRSSSGKSPN
ncbi:serine hydrolase domain-containing protein [Cellulosimicrobium marinum]|uniref:serine hydrolase domain-containing protein n=1 Tax=Cellulosimicrobium marinum TaxID=1638992 RepID=UPI001E5A06EC|nr:serine hydrolase domain-containing protein [Cellulosimicrobium marinum]MCB7137124.1 beta-lactamase family protein [Cellulosimicrobium marinum]